MSEDRSDALTVAKRLYDAFRERDGAALASLLHPEFSGHVSDGMPLGVGGPVRNREEMLRVWGTIAAHYDVRPVPEEFIHSTDSRIVVVGHYRGSGQGGNGPIDAVFAHILDIRADRVASLKQITDTARWCPRQ